MMVSRIIVIVSMCLTVGNSVYAQESLVLGGIQGSQNHQISAAVLRCAYENLDIRVSFETYPARRSLSESNAGRIDGEVQRIDGMEKDYPKLIKVPVPIHFLIGTAYTKEVFFPVEGWESLQPYTVGIVRGVKFAEKGTQGLNRISADSVPQLIELLDKGRVDVVIQNPYSMAYHLRKMGVEGITRLEPDIKVVPLFHYLHKKHAKLVAPLTEILKKMEESGELEEIRLQAIEELLLDDPVFPGKPSSRLFRE